MAPSSGELVEACLVAVVLFPAGKVSDVALAPQQMPAEARPLRYAPVALGAGIRKTLSAASFENPINTRSGLSLICHTENS